METARLTFKTLKRTHIAVHMVITPVVGFITPRTVVVLLMINVKTADGASRTILVGVWKDGVDIIAPRNRIKFVKTEHLFHFLTDTMIFFNNLI